MKVPISGLCHGHFAEVMILMHESAHQWTVPWALRRGHDPDDVFTVLWVHTVCYNHVLIFGGHISPFCECLCFRIKVVYKKQNLSTAWFLMQVDVCVYGES
eukprot:TRINITY_DN78547_c0_g1_i4.p1 TRINITY_DN78547_c0_g1~~TRINITY_DN78547_c0_g1_i4.p1  ORF type:complete len:101 (+),score=14.89 TRINITY_DN78547_c0_g1_i4:59-361(+)